MHWFLIANSSSARLLEQQAPGKPVLLQSFEHPQSRQRSATLGDDRPGWSMGRDHRGGTPQSPHETPQDKERSHFATELARYLDKQALEGRFEALTLFAPPEFLGELRGHLGDIAARRVQASRPLDLTHLGLTELVQRVEQELAAAG